MAIISFTNYKRGQSSGCMRAVMRYTMQEKKTLWDGQRLVAGVNCQPESAYASMGFELPSDSKVCSSRGN